MSYLAAIAADATTGVAWLRNSSSVLHSAGGMLVLLAATGLAVYKPRGLTRYGRRAQVRAPGAARGSGGSGGT